LKVSSSASEPQICGDRLEQVDPLIVTDAPDCPFPNHPGCLGNALLEERFGQHLVDADLNVRERPEETQGSLVHVLVGVPVEERHAGRLPSP
jgi:hypothetical protein